MYIYITIYIYEETNKCVCIDFELNVLNTHNINPKLNYPSLILIFIELNLVHVADEAKLGS